MLTKRQLQSYSTKAGVPLLTVERDYIQTLFLYEVFTHSTTFFFKGGTCLRMAYQLNRYSEDLDFNYNDEPIHAMNTLKDAASRLNDFGVECQIKTINDSFSGFTTKLLYKGPLYIDMDLSIGSIAIDVSCRKETIQTATQPFHPVYHDCPSFVLQCLTLDHLFAEKVRALLIRHKPRDLYDVWFLHTRVNPNRELLNEKLQLYNTTLEDIDLHRVFSSIENDWERDLGSLLGVVPPYQEIHEVVARKLQEWKK